MIKARDYQCYAKYDKHGTSTLAYHECYASIMVQRHILTPASFYQHYFFLQAHQVNYVCKMNHTMTKLMKWPDIPGHLHILILYLYMYLLNSHYRFLIQHKQ